MEKKIIGLITVWVIAVVAISGCTGDEKEILKEFENERLLFKYPNTFTQVSPGPEYKYINYAVLEIFEDKEKGESINVEIIKMEGTTEQLYDYYERESIKRHNIQTIEFTMENTTINGIPAIKISEELKTPMHKYQYVIALAFMLDGMFYSISFQGNNLQSIESLYANVSATIDLKIGKV